MQRRTISLLTAAALAALLLGLGLLFRAGSENVHAQGVVPSPVQTQVAQAGNGDGAVDPLPRSSATSTPTCIPPAEVVDSNSIPNFNELYDAAVVSPNDVWAVGTYYRSNFGISFTLVQHWDGSQWTTVPSPNPTPGSGTYTQNVLRSVAAVSANDIWAVGTGSGTGSSYPVPLIEHWNGSAWSIVPGPTLQSLASYGLYAVTALAADDIWAVGTYSAVYPYASGAYILHYNGSTWTEVPNSVPGTLYSVDAISPTDIWAVGGGINATPGAPVSAHYDGTSWTEVDVPNPSAQNADLTGVAAVAPNDVWAVGKYPYAGGNALLTLIMHWDGTQWSVVPTQGEPGATHQLSGIVAISPTDIWASGWAEPAGQGASPTRAITMHYNGAGWIWGPAAEVQPGTLANKMYGIAALDNGNIWTVGSAGSTYTLAEKWSGAEWQLTQSASPGLGTNTLSNVSALSENDIWAVGYSETAGRLKTLTQHWDGAKWTIVPSPNQGESPTQLRDVAAISTNDVWAVGVSGPGPEYTTFIIHWDGQAWTQVPSPNPYLGYINSLYAVTAVSSSDIYAVGSYGLGGYFPFILHWNGAEWSVVANTGTTGQGVLYGVSATGPNDIWAVGLNDFYPNPTTPLILHWNGSAWGQMVVPGINGYLYGVVAISPGDAWAVGTYSPDGTRSDSLTLHWDGAAWTQVPSPNSPAAVRTYLTGVSARAPNDVWAAGYFYYYPTAPNSATFMLHWDGAQWAQVTTQDTGIISTRLLGVEALPGDGVWAVGAAMRLTPDQAPVDQSLVEYVGRYSDVHPYDYYSAAVNYLSSRGIISGYEDCTFRPGLNATRGQVCKIIVLAQGWPIDVSNGPHFRDVGTGNVFYQYIETAWHHGIISGYADGRFRPDNNITRAQLSKVIVLAHGWPLDTTGGPHFSDVGTASPFYAYVETAYHHSVISGYADGTFRPGANATRGQISKIVYYAMTLK